MNVRCTQCQTVFRVDPEKVPAAGVRARCARCGAVFELGPTQATATAPPSIAPAPPPAPAITPPALATQATTAAPTPAPIAPPSAPLSPGAPTAAAPPAASAPAPGVRPLPPRTLPPLPGAAAPSAASAGAATPAPPKRPSFLQQDPNTRAQRLARALVSDILAYNKDRLTESRAAGTLKNDFREEIKKSWEEYVAQVGLEMAKSTPFFRDALNQILANGEKVF